MSTDLYYRRLAYYAGRGGVAKEGNLVLHLDAPPPVIPNLVEIDYGESHRGELAWPPFVRLHGHSQKRDMTPPEILLVRDWLGGLLRAVIKVAASPPNPEERRKS